MTLVPSEPHDPRLERFLSLQAGQYWRANEAIPSEAIEAGWVLLIQSVRYVDEAMHTVVLRAHPSVYGKEVVKRTERGGETHESRVTAGEHRFLVGDFETLFTYEPDHRAVRDAEMNLSRSRAFTPYPRAQLLSPPGMPRRAFSCISPYAAGAIADAAIPTLCRPEGGYAGGARAQRSKCEDRPRGAS